MEAKEKFGKMIFLLAKECDKELPRDIIPIYQSMANFYGFELLAQAVEYVLRKRRSRDPFPTPFEIEEICKQIRGQGQSSAEEIAGKILRAISHHGYTDPVGAQKSIGKVGWEIVRLHGGWSNLCQNMQTSQTTTFLAQWRNLAERLLEKQNFTVDKKLTDGSAVRQIETCLSEVSTTSPSAEEV